MGDGGRGTIVAFAADHAHIPCQCFIFGLKFQFWDFVFGSVALLAHLALLCKISEWRFWVPTLLALAPAQLS